MTKWDDFRKNREGFANAQGVREGQHRLHKSQAKQYDFRRDLDDATGLGPKSHKSLSRLRFYVTLGDPSLGPFVQDAKSKATAAYLSGTRDWHHHYTIDIADVSIRLKNRACHIKIIAVDEFYAEFATTAYPIVTDTVVVDGASYPSYSGCIVGCKFSARDNSVSLKSTIREQRRSSDGATLSLVNRPFQVQLTNEPVHYPKGKSSFQRWHYQTTLFGTYAPGHSHTGSAQKRTTQGPSGTFVQSVAPGPLGTYTFRDIDLDVPFQRGERDNDLVSAYIRGAADWPRKSGLQTVTSQWGDREFAIYLDAFNQFAIFPVAQIGPLNNVNPMLQNVDDTFVRRITPTFPAWCYIAGTKAKDYWALNPNLDQWGIDEPEIEWQFNHLGTKAAAVVYEREPYANDAAYWASDANPDCPWTGTKFDNYKSVLGIESTAVMTDPSSYQPDRYFVAPGVVEASITIEITGPGDNDFTATVTIAEKRRPTTDYAMPVFAGYVWHDVPTGGQSGKPLPNTELIARAGDLMIAYLEYWVRPLGSEGELTQRALVWSIRKADSNAEVLSYPGMPILALDFTTLSFVFMPNQYRREMRTRSLRSGAPGAPGSDEIMYSVREFGIWIVTMGKGREFQFPNTLTADAQQRLIAITGETGRAYVDRLIADAGDGSWGLLPMSSAKDGWVDTGYNEYRAWWAYQFHFAEVDYWALLDSDLSFYGDKVKYKITGGAAPSLTAAAQAARKELNAGSGDHQHLLFCDAPKWNWHFYETVFPLMMYKHPLNTFFTHANGSYAFFDNGWLYDANGVVGNAGKGYGDTGGTGTEWYYNSLNDYDASLVEHVIFDAVHFQLRTTKGVIASRDTTFRDLYNDAVIAGKKAQTLEAGIDEMPLSAMKATFTKEIANNGDYDFLDLKATWIGTDWWMHDFTVYGEPFDVFPAFANSGGNLYGANFWGFWRTTNYAGGVTSKVPGLADPLNLAVWNYKFANMLIIDART